jgi:hypothetical protein
MIFHQIHLPPATTLLDCGRGKTIIGSVPPQTAGGIRSTELSNPLLLIAMKLRFFTGLVAIVCMSLASCYPYNESTQKDKANKKTEKTAPTPDELKKKEEELKKKEDELKKKEDSVTGGNPSGPGTVEPPVERDTPPEKPRTDYAFANKVPGKEGFVFSPYNNKVVDVRDIPTGTLVQDPTYPAAEKKYFRVP